MWRELNHHTKLFVSHGDWRRLQCQWPCHFRAVTLRQLTSHASRRHEGYDFVIKLNDVNVVVIHPCGRSFFTLSRIVCRSWLATGICCSKHPYRQYCRNKWLKTGGMPAPWSSIAATMRPIAVYTGFDVVPVRSHWVSIPRCLGILH